MFPQSSSGLRVWTSSSPSIQKVLNRQSAARLSMSYKSYDPTQSVQSMTSASLGYEEDASSSLQSICESHFTRPSTLHSAMSPSGHVPCKFPVRSHNVYSDHSIHNAGVVKPLSLTVETLFTQSDIKNISSNNLFDQVKGMSSSTSASTASLGRKHTLSFSPSSASVRSSSSSSSASY